MTTEDSITLEEHDGIIRIMEVQMGILDKTVTKQREMISTAIKKLAARNNGMVEAIKMLERGEAVDDVAKVLKDALTQV